MEQLSNQRLKKEAVSNELKEFFPNRNTIKANQISEYFSH